VKQNLAPSASAHHVEPTTDARIDHHGCARADRRDDRGQDVDRRRSAIEMASATLAALERELIAADRVDAHPAQSANAAIARLVRMAIAYLDFAAANTPRWRTLFEHRTPVGREVPAWYRDEQQRLFAYVEALLLELQAQESRVRRALLARSLFSAVQAGHARA
jgi:hypothetical protein